MINTLLTKVIDAIVDRLDIPKSYYRRAAERHKSLGEWLCRPNSAVAHLNPTVASQGSFRYGTVIVPVHTNWEYDLDNVAILQLAKTALTQKQIKDVYGSEIKGYALAHGMQPPEEKNRCWRLHYSDEVKFHIDSLPSLVEEQTVINAIISRGVPPHLAALAVAITDKRHPEYQTITRALLSSNPRGFAAWFEERTRPWAGARIKKLVEQRFYASVEDVPPYEWRTPLQRSIQLLKRHRDVMFRDNPSGAPISMIITNLSAHAYSGEPEIGSALTNILESMPQYVRDMRPRVPNPADPAEDYADKWTKNPMLEQNFWTWHAQAKADLANLSDLIGSSRLAERIRQIFAVDLTADDLKKLGISENSPTMPLVRSAPALSIRTAPRPWSNRD